MKEKFSILVLFIIFALLFNSCDFLNEDDNNGNDQQIVGVEPLIQTQWWQYSPYNDLFPIASEGYTLPVDNAGRTLTDCTNTALAQIMYYHKHPAQGIGQSIKLWPMHSYGQTEDVYVNLEVPFSWDNMLNKYPNANSGTEPQRNAVATLMYHAAAARGATDGFLHRALVEKFGYDRSMQTHQRSFYTNAEWEAIIRQQLDLKLPVWYSGNHPGGSHTFIVDGYDNNGRFHINWGWGGQHDGWYSLDNLNPNDNKRYYNNQSIVINIKPDEGSTGSNEFWLQSFTADKTAVQQKESFTVIFNLRSIGFYKGGQFGAVLVDNNSNIKEVIGSMNYNWEITPGYNTGVRTINCSVSENVSIGQYSLKVVTRVQNGEWKIVTLSPDNAPTSINFMVQ